VSSCHIAREDIDSRVCRGLSAAQELQAACPDSEVVVVEASEHVGGRVRQGSFEGIDIDLGAQWIHGEVSRYTLPRVFLRV